MYIVRFNFEEKGLEPVTLDQIEAGQTLLEVALGNDIDLHHNCGGVCSCTTCNVFVEKGMDHLDEISRREKDFLARVIHYRPNSRLGCQSLLLEGEGEIEITLPDQSSIPDEE